MGVFYRLHEVVGVVGKPGDVHFGVQLPVDEIEQVHWAGDAHHSLPADLHTDTVIQLLHRYLQGRTNGVFPLPPGTYLYLSRTGI